VIVWYPPKADDIQMLIEKLKTEGPQRWIMRKLQRFAVTIPAEKANRMLAEGSLNISPLPGLYIQKLADGLYSDVIGLFVGDIPFNPTLVI
jgi:CRISPR-associated endonuclease/helicase Cas3